MKEKNMDKGREMKRRRRRNRLLLAEMAHFCTNRYRHLDVGDEIAVLMAQAEREL